MKVAILYSGGKDSTFAVDYCKQHGWDITCLISIKPTRKDCFLFHFATVEHTPKIAEMLGIKHILATCNVADPQKEAEIVKNEVIKQQKTNPIEALVLGGTGLQLTQLKSIQDSLKSLSIEVFAARSGMDHEDEFRSMVDNGYEIMITQVASDGLMNWLGKVITKDNFEQLVSDSKKYGFHIGFEGGYADTLVLNCPLFSKRLEITMAKKIIDDNYCGHMELDVELANKIKVVPKVIVELA